MIWLSSKSNFSAFWMHLHNSTCFQKHLKVLLQSLRALCLASGGRGSIWKYLETVVRLSGVSGRIACGFRTDCHFADADGRQPILNTLLHLSQHPKEMLRNERIWLEEHQNRVRGYEAVPGRNEPQKLQGSVKAWQQCGWNHTNHVDQWKLGNSAWDKELENSQCLFSIMWWFLSTLGSPKCLLAVAQSISVIPAFPYHPTGFPCQTEWCWCRENDFHSTMASKCICKLATFVLRRVPSIPVEYHLQRDRLYYQDKDP